MGYIDTFLLGGDYLHIVFIVGGYFPYYSAVGKCVGNVAEELSKDHQVTVLCQRSNSGQKTTELYNNQKIIRVDTKETKIRNRLNEKINSRNGLTQEINKVLLNLYKVFIAIKMLFLNATIKNELIEAFYGALKEIDEPIDLIIPSSLPFESVLSSIEYISRNNVETKVIPYLFDQFTDNPSLHRTRWNKMIKRKNHLKLEEYILANSHSILIMNQLEKHFRHNFSAYADKVNVVEHPLLKVNTCNYENLNSDNINIVYTGSFYKKIRNPEYFLNVAEQSLHEIDAVLNIYSFGNCENIIENYSKRYPLKILNHGKVTTEKAYDAISSSDILVAVGNSDNSQIPSKIFEYMSFGKPIVYFYTVDDDANLKVLERYPYRVFIKQDYELMDENVKRFVGFCNSYSKIRVGYNEIKKIYVDATPRYTADLIINLFNEDY